MAAFSKKEEEGLSSYYNNKTTVIQEARVFNESPISPRKCRALLTRIVYLLYIGENFGTQEATTLFFGTTKLFQHKDVRDYLRHLQICLPHAHNTLLECLASDDLPVHQRTGSFCRGRHHGHKQYHERYAAEFGGHISSQRNSGAVSHHRCMFNVYFVYLCSYFLSS